MTDKEKRNITIEGSITIMSCITIVLGFLKCLDLITLDWQWILAPLWVPVLLLALLLLFLKYFG